MGLLMGAAFLPGVERESDSVQQGWSFFITVAREVGGDPIRKKVKHCVNIISTLFLLLLLLFLPSPLLTAAVQGKGIVSIISVIREREKEGGGKDPFFSWREILLLPTTLNLLFIIRGIIKRREGRNRLGLIRPCNDRSIDLLISPSDDEENSTPYPVYTQGRGWGPITGRGGESILNAELDIAPSLTSECKISMVEGILAFPSPPPLLPPHSRSGTRFTPSPPLPSIEASMGPSVPSSRRGMFGSPIPGT